MTLRARLSLVLGLLVFVPLAIGVLALGVVVPDQLRTTVADEVRSDKAAVARALADRCEAVRVAARAVGSEAVATSPQRAVSAVVRDGYADYTAVLDAPGEVVAAAGTLPPGVAVAPGALGSCARGDTAGAVLAEVVPVPAGSPAGLAAGVAAVRVDAETLLELRRTLDVGGDVTLLAGGAVVATTASADRQRAIQELGTGDDVAQGAVSRDSTAAAVHQAAPGLPFDVVVTDTVPDATALLRNVGLLVVLLVLLAILVARLAAARVTGPLGELTAAVERVAGGDLDSAIDVRSNDEIGRLSRAFNDMTDELRVYVTEVERNRDELRANLERLGEALSSTHDLDGLLQVVLETALSSARARAGAVLLEGTDGSVLMPHTHQGLRARGLDVPRDLRIGSGVLGGVAASGDSVRGRLASGPLELEPVPGEPARGEVLAVALRRSTGVLGVLALYDRVDEAPFDEADEHAIRTLAGQAGIALENVLLHREAQRLSITDGLTGLWNFRYLSMSLSREIERASRFERPLGLLMLDLDHFKDVNDTFGHQRGDAVLQEFAERVNAEIREVDTLARYGGEEFALVLPETALDGVVQLAERIREAIRARPFGRPGEQPVRVTVSLGAAVFPDHGTSAAALLRRADEALYTAKHDGRDRWAVSTVPSGPRVETADR